MATPEIIKNYNNINFFNSLFSDINSMILSEKEALLNNKENNLFEKLTFLITQKSVEISKDIKSLIKNFISANLEFIDMKNQNKLMSCFTIIDKTDFSKIIPNITKSHEKFNIPINNKWLKFTLDSIMLLDVMKELNMISNKITKDFNKNLLKLKIILAGKNNNENNKINYSEDKARLKEIMQNNIGKSEFNLLDTKDFTLQKQKETRIL